MRSVLTVAATLVLASIGRPQALEKQVSDALREVHDRGRELYNAGDAAAGYRIYQGGLLVARGVLTHRPDVQRLITDGLIAAEREPSVARRAFMLHELIEKVRVEVRSAARKAETVVIPPREVKTGEKGTAAVVKPSATVGEVKEGVIGRVLWQGQPVAGVDVTFVTLGQPTPRVYETTTGPQGVYAVPKLPAGKYVVLITPGPNAQVKKLPERYATSTNSPLIFDVKGGGEKLDFMLQ
ncbi:MAG TPA: carboxypeptidase-like regulatory domain-containing protein [Gemmataceae bacterium]|nr:carboxypeptidase-like regulatory domain-containing protein [Gemmataceae bacterium]